MRFVIFAYCHNIGQYGFYEFRFNLCHQFLCLAPPTVLMRVTEAPVDTLSRLMFSSPSVILFFRLPFFFRLRETLISPCETLDRWFKEFDSSYLSTPAAIIMTQLKFSYSSLLADQNGEEIRDAGMISFNVNFSEDPGTSEFKRVCYAMALDEVTAVLNEKYGEEMFDGMPDISVTISGLTIV